MTSATENRALHSEQGPRLPGDLETLLDNGVGGTYAAIVCYLRCVKYLIELELEEDGRWIAEVSDIPGVMVYGSTRDQALAGAQALALRVLADRIEHGELPPGSLDLSFEAA
jgi:predicted RNase H-like HicB family nuclease